MTTVATSKQSIKSLQDLLRASPYPKSWWRGQSKDWPLLPGVLRDGAKQDLVDRAGPHSELSQERLLFREFLRVSAFLLDRTVDDAEAYFIAQHHRLPTRLLDWTANPGAALYFAVMDSPEEDGVLYRLFAGGVPIPGAATRSSGHGPVQPDDPLCVLLVGHLAGMHVLPNNMFETALPVAPRLRHERMLNQGSCFTFHPPEVFRSDACREFRPGDLWRYTVPAASKERLRGELGMLRITPSLLFPDLDHVVSDLRREFGVS